MSSSAETVANIEEIVTQILVSLPALSLIRFKCVSKQWLSRITNPDFRRRHTLRNPNPNKVLAFFSSEIQENVFKSIPLGSPSGNPFKALKIDSVLDLSKLIILQSCNGLFLCHIPIKCLFQKQTKQFPAYVINPTTNESRAISSPWVSEADMSDYFVRYGLAFDPSKSPHYKLVCVSNLFYRHRGHHKIDIYSSETGTWGKHLEFSFLLRPSDGYPDLFITSLNTKFEWRSRKDVVYSNGALHWIRTGPPRVCVDEDRRFEYRREESDVLHYFDIGEERLRLAATPPPLPLCVQNLLVEGKIPYPLPRLVHRYFGESRGHLYMIETYEHSGAEFEVMEMERDYSGWSVKYHVDLNPVVAAFSGQDRNAFVVLGIFEEEGIDDEDSSPDLWLHMPGKVVSYNLRSNSLKRSVELVDKEHFQASSSERSWLDYDNHLYMDSLASV